MSLWKLVLKKCLAFSFLFPCFSSFWPGGVLSFIFSSQLENGKKGEVSQRKCKQKCKVSPQKRQIATCNPQQLKRKFNSDTRQLKVHIVSYRIDNSCDRFLDHHLAHPKTGLDFRFWPALDLICGQSKVSPANRSIIHRSAETKFSGPRKGSRLSGF